MQLVDLDIIYAFIYQIILYAAVKRVETLTILYLSGTSKVKTLNRYRLVLWIESRHTIRLLKASKRNFWKLVMITSEKVSVTRTGRSGS